MDTSPQTVKTTFDNMTMAGNKAFKDSFEKSLGAIAEMNAHSKKNLEALVASMTAATKGAEFWAPVRWPIRRRRWKTRSPPPRVWPLRRVSRKRLNCRPLLPRRPSKSYVAEVTHMSETVAASVKETVAPINERVTALVERVQSAH